MKKGMKKVVALAAVTAMSMTALMGCASSIDNSEVVATVGEKEITAGLANFYTRYQQASVESYYESMLGENIWSLEIQEGYTYEDNIKETIMGTLQEMYLLDLHAADYEVAITEDEMAEIEATVAAFEEANDEETKKLISGEPEYITEMLRLTTLSEKVSAAITAEVDTEVSDDEAAQKRVRYVSFAKVSTDDSGAEVEMTEDEIAAVKKEAEDFLTAAKANGSLEAYATEAEVESLTVTFDSESTTISENFIKTVDALGEGKFAAIIEEEDAIYVAQLESLLDREATDTEKESIVATRQSEKYAEVVEAWYEETEIVVNDKVWDKIKLGTLDMTVKAAEEDTTTEE